MLARVDELLSSATHRIRVISRARPRDPEAQARALVEALAGERVQRPEVVDSAAVGGLAHGPPRERDELSSLGAALAEAHELVTAYGLVGTLYAARIEELSLELTVVHALGTPSLPPLARRRYGPRDGFDALADVLASGWLAAGPEGLAAAGARDASELGDERFATDDPSTPRSLLSQMRKAVGEARLPFAVVTRASMLALAATGDDVIQVARGRRCTEHDAARTVVHELRGHAGPLAHARGEHLGLFRVGTARGSDDQEGLAVLEEERAGLFDHARRFSLAARHVAARAAHEGAPPSDVARLLLRAGLTAERAARVLVRVYRAGGLGREAIYLPAYLRVKQALDEDPSLGAQLRRGRVSVPAARALAG